MTDVAVVIRNSRLLTGVLARIVDQPILLGPPNTLLIPVQGELRRGYRWNLG
jgi:hypothetical protein